MYINNGVYMNSDCVMKGVALGEVPLSSMEHLNISQLIVFGFTAYTFIVFRI